MQVVSAVIARRLLVRCAYKSMVMTYTGAYASTASPADLPPPKPLPRPEPIETTRARLVYQSHKHGTLESDLLLSTFAREHHDAMDAEELSEFDQVRFVWKEGTQPSLVPCERCFFVFF
jgi:hypothetical protein